MDQERTCGYLGYLGYLGRSAPPKEIWRAVSSRQSTHIQYSIQSYRLTVYGTTVDLLPLNVVAQAAANVTCLQSWMKQAYRCIGVSVYQKYSPGLRFSIRKSLPANDNK